MSGSNDFQNKGNHYRNGRGIYPWEMIDLILDGYGLRGKHTIELGSGPGPFSTQMAGHVIMDSVDKASDAIKILNNDISALYNASKNGNAGEFSENLKRIKPSGANDDVPAEDEFRHRIRLSRQSIKPMETLEGKKYDAAFFATSLHWFIQGNYEGLMDKLHEIIKPGGQIFLPYSTFDRGAPMGAELAEIYEKVFPKFTEKDPKIYQNSGKWASNVIKEMRPENEHTFHDKREMGKEQFISYVSSHSWSEGVDNPAVKGEFERYFDKHANIDTGKLELPWFFKLYVGELKEKVVCASI